MGEPGGTGPIGPYPSRVVGAEAADAYDKMRRRLLWTVPSGLYVVGSRSGARRNLMTLNWFTQVSFEPKLVAIAVDRHAVTHELVDAGRVFTVNTVRREDRALVRKFTKPAELDEAAQTLNGLAYLEATTGAPILAQAVAYLDCEVRQAVETGSHTLFVGEVVDGAFLAPEDTEVLRMEDTRMNYGG